MNRERFEPGSPTKVGGNEFHHVFSLVYHHPDSDATTIVQSVVDFQGICMATHLYNDPKFECATRTTPKKPQASSFLSETSPDPSGGKVRSEAAGWEGRTLVEFGIFFFCKSKKSPIDMILF